MNIQVFRSGRYKLDLAEPVLREDLAGMELEVASAIQ
jgi:hypothetical protein